MSQVEKKFFRLQSIELARKEYGDHEGRIVGKIRFKDGYDNEMSLMLSEDKAQKIMVLLAEQLVEQTQQISGDMATRIIEQAKGPLLTGPDA